MSEYRTIVIDPPWRYEGAVPAANGSGRLSGLATRPRTAEHQYPTMTNAAIAALPVGELAAADAHLYLWVTNPRLFGERRDGITPAEMVKAWGFAYKTLLTWHKNTGAPGMGFYFRGDTEHVLFGVRGKCPIDPALRVSNHFAAPRTGHSSKPDRFYEIVEAVSPEPRLEMFARRRRVGWDVWGDEAPPEDEARTQTHFGMSA